MDISLSYQAFSFFAMIICGILCGVIFDIFRSFRRHRKSACSVVALQDIVFWILELCLVYAVAFKLNYAHIRAYEGIALVIGSWLYFMTVSDFVLGALCKGVAYAVKLTGAVLAPFKKVAEFIGNILRKLRKFVSKSLKNLINRAKTVQKHIQKAKNIFTI